MTGVQTCALPISQTFPNFVNRIDGRFRKARSVSVGGGFVCARFGDDSAWCWGRNDQGQLGSGNTKMHTAPSPTFIDSATRLGRIVSISAGSAHACAVEQQSAAERFVFCWGDNRSAQLGDGTTTSRSWATLVRGFPVDLAPLSVSCGSNQTMVFGRSAAVPAEPVFGWGRNAGGQLGLGATSPPVLLPTRVTDLNGA